MNFWGMYSSVYDGLMWLQPYVDLNRSVINVLKTNKSKLILDAGCGTGNLENLITHEMDNEVKIEGLDNSISMLQTAKKKHLDNTNFQQVDLNKTLPFRNAYFDAVVAINSLYAISNIDSFLKEIFRVTKPGGILAIVNPKKGAGIFVHIKKQFFSKHAWKLLIGLPLMILIGLFNIIIIMKAGKNEYKFLDYNDLKSKLLDAGYISITSSSVYSEQANLIIGYK